jgi:hypothetical protein
MLVQMVRPQIPLLSVFVAFLLAGGLLGYNVASRTGRVLSIEAIGHAPPMHRLYKERGFPLTFEEWSTDQEVPLRAFDWRALTINIVFGVAVLVFAGAGVEMLVRRKLEARK